MSGFEMFPSQLKLEKRRKKLRLSKIVSDNPIIAHNYGSRSKYHFFKSSFSHVCCFYEKGKFWNPTLSDITCSRITITQLKLLILVSFFSGENTPSTDIGHYTYITGTMKLRFFWPPCIHFATLGYIAISISVANTEYRAKDRRFRDV